MSKGFLKVPRRYFDEAMFLEEAFTKWQAWIDLANLAHFEEERIRVRGNDIIAKRGVAYIGKKELARRWQWSRGKVERFLTFLVDVGWVSIDSDDITSRIEVLDYDEFQGSKEVKKKGKKTIPLTIPLSVPIDGQKTVPSAKPVTDTKSDSKNGGMETAIPLAGHPHETKTIPLTGPLYKNNKEKEELRTNVRTAGAASCATVGGDGNAEMEVSEISESTVAKSLNATAREIFEARYLEVTEKEYYWEAKDAGAMTRLLKKIRYSREQRKMPTDDMAMANALAMFLTGIDDAWVLQHFTTTTIDSKYNDIRSQARKRITDGAKDNISEYERGRLERQRDAANIMQRLWKRNFGEQQPVPEIFGEEQP